MVLSPSAVLGDVDERVPTPWGCEFVFMLEQSQLHVCLTCPMNMAGVSACIKQWWGGVTEQVLLHGCACASARPWLDRHGCLRRARQQDHALGRSYLSLRVARVWCAAYKQLITYASGFELGRTNTGHC